MEYETVNEKRENTCNEVDIAKDEVNYKKLQLKENLENINKILHGIKKRRKIISSLIYLKSNWTNSINYEEQLKMARRSLEGYLTCYKTLILERKLLKNKFKQAQRKLSKKKKRLGEFYNKYFPEEY